MSSWLDRGVSGLIIEYEGITSFLLCISRGYNPGPRHHRTNWGIRPFCEREIQDRTLLVAHIKNERGQG